MSDLRILFHIPIGDWSGDGHGKCDYFLASAEGSLEEVREAYFAAKNKLPEIICPENICSEYEEHSIDRETFAALIKAGFDLFEKNELGAGEVDYFDLNRMAQLVVWFINQGNSKINAQLEPELEPQMLPFYGLEPQMLPFYGFDSKGRHIGFIGYGILGD